MNYKRRLNLHLLRFQKFHQLFNQVLFRRLGFGLLHRLFSLRFYFHCLLGRLDRKLRFLRFLDRFNSRLGLLGGTFFLVVEALLHLLGISLMVELQKPLENLYPGDAVVDRVGLDGYNWGTTQAWSTWQSFGEVFGPGVAELDALSSRPIHVTETGAPEGAGGDKAAWITDMWAWLDAHPEAVARWLVDDPAFVTDLDTMADVAALRAMPGAPRIELPAA